VAFFLQFVIEFNEKDQST